jgi:cyclophilin family peptidyl-prolyl cis-trans isomerase
VPSVTLGTINEPDIPTDKPIFIPVTVTNTPAGAVTTTVASDNPNLTATVVQGGRSVRFDVSGIDAGGQPFTGSITLRLFEAQAPQATQRIIDLVNSGYYVNKTFPRVLDNFVIQGGETTTSGNSPLPNLPDEFNPDLTFASRGVFAFANSGDDTENSQFFITDIDVPLAQRPTSLNFNHTIMGILTDGFDIYDKIIHTQVGPNGAGENSAPTNPVKITGATVFSDTENAVIKLTPNASFGTATAHVTVTATDGTTPTTQTFNITGVADNVNSRAFITTPVPNQTTTAGTPVTFTVPATDIDGDQVTFAVKDSAFSTTTIPNATVSIDQATGKVTITPAAGFTGTIQFKVGVRDQTNRSTGGTLDDAGNFDTQLVTLTVNPATSTSPPPPAAGSFTASGSAPGSAAAVTVLNADGTVRFNTPVFDPGFLGGVHVAVGDVDGDGTKDVVAVPGYGGGPIILVLDSTTGAVKRMVTVFDPTFRGGLHLQVGDLNGLGYAQVLVGAGDTGGPRVTLLDLKQNKQLLNFFAGDSTTRGGVDVDAADVFQGKGQMIVTGSGPGPAATVSLFSTTGATVGSFSAGTDTTGIQVRVGDMANGVRPIFVAPLTAADGTNETQFDPSKFIDPDKPASSSTTTTTTNGSNIDLSSLGLGG